MLGELQHADLVGVLGGGAAAWDGFAVIATARKRTRGKKARSEGDKVPARDTQHGDQLRFAVPGARQDAGDAVFDKALYRIKARKGYTNVPPRRAQTRYRRVTRRGLDAQPTSRRCRRSVAAAEVSRDPRSRGRHGTTAVACEERVTMSKTSRKTGRIFDIVTLN